MEPVSPNSLSCSPYRNVARLSSISRRRRAIWMPPARLANESASPCSNWLVHRFWAIQLTDAPGPQCRVLPSHQPSGVVLAPVQVAVALRNV